MNMIDTEPELLTRTTDPDRILSIPETPGMQTLQRNGVALAYTEAGSGTPPFMFIHSWAGDHTIFTPQLAHFSQTHRTIAVDLRGHGQSDTPEQSYTLASFADDIAWLCSQLDVVKPVIVGHCMGGNIALELAARYPDVAAAIVLLDTVVFPLPGLKENVLLPNRSGTAWTCLPRGDPTGNLRALPADR